MDKELTTKVKSFARRSGADLVGIALVESFSKAPKGHRPGDLLKGAKKRMRHPEIDFGPPVGREVW